MVIFEDPKGSFAIKLCFFQDRNQSEKIARHLSHIIQFNHLL